MSQSLAKITHSDPLEQSPPLLGTWRRVYFWVLMSQVVFAAGLWAMARFFGAPK